MTNHEMVPGEEFILAGCWKREPEAVAGFIDIFAKPLYGFLIALLPGDEERRKKILLKTVWNAMRSSEFFDPRWPFLPQLIKRLLLNYFSEGGRKKESQLSSSDLYFETDPGMKVQMLFLIQILMRMNFKEKLYVLLRDQMGLTYQEMEWILGVPERELKKDLANARLHFRELVEKGMSRKEIHELRQN